MPTAGGIQDKEEATGDQIRSSKIALLRMPSPSRISNEGTLSCPAVFKTVLQKVHHFKVDVVVGDANAAALLKKSSVAVVLREMQREVNTGRPFENSNNNHFSQLRSASDLDCCFMAILSW